MTLTIAAAPGCQREDGRPQPCPSGGTCPAGLVCSGGLCLAAGTGGNDGGGDLFSGDAGGFDVVTRDGPKNTDTKTIIEPPDDAVDLALDRTSPSDGDAPSDFPPAADLPRDGAACQSPRCLACDDARVLPAVKADPAGSVLQVSGTTSGTGQFEGSCTFQNGPHSPLGPEAIHRLDLDFAAEVEADTLLGEIDTVLYVRSDCVSGPDLACNDDDQAEFQSRFTVTLQPGSYYFFVDGFAQQTMGNYTLRLRVTPQ